ncbi:MAG: hypothetical protein WCO08_01530 [Actinomycetes bacterium]
MFERTFEWNAPLHSTYPLIVSKLQSSGHRNLVVIPEKFTIHSPANGATLLVKVPFQISCKETSGGGTHVLVTAGAMNRNRVSEFLARRRARGIVNTIRRSESDFF